MKIEIELLLNDFREEQKELFNDKGIAHKMLSHVDPMGRMLELINALEREEKQLQVTTEKLLNVLNEIKNNLQSYYDGADSKILKKAKTLAKETIDSFNNQKK